QRWTFPEGTILDEGEYVTVFADGFDIGLHTNFQLASAGEWIGLYNPDGQIVDSLSIPFIGRNYSLGRHIDTKQWGWYDQASPDSANESIWYYGVAERPYFSLLPSFYQETQTIQILHDDPTVTIRYQLGGFNADSQGIVHNSPITLTSSNVIRAKAFKEGYLPSKTATQTYYIAETPPGIPVIAITTNPPNLWDDQIGIYVTGTNGIRDNGPETDPPRNWNQDWEKESVFEYLDTTNTLVLQQNVGIKIFGGWSRAYPQKSLSVFARKRYGNDRLEYPFFSQKDFPRYKSMILRNSGNDWSGGGGVMMRDAFQQALVFGRMDIDQQAYQPSALYLNGEYWGIHNQREKLNENYLLNNHLINENELDLLRNNREVFNGNARAYNQMLNFVRGHPLNFNQNYQLVQREIDVREFMDYFILQTYINNRDWPGNNIKFWRAHAPGSRWRWLLYDTDFGFGIWNFQPSDNNLEFALATNGPGWPNPPWSTELFRLMTGSNEFREIFAQRYLSHLNYSFHPDRIDHLLDSLSQNIDVAIRQHLSRWGGNYFSWRSAIDEMRDFGRLRPQYSRQHLRTQFALGREVNMRLWWPNPEGGSVHEQEYRLSHLMGGTYLTNLPISLYARPEHDYEFVGWELSFFAADSTAPSGNAKLYASPRLSQKLDLDSWVQPVFAPLDAKMAAFRLPDSTTQFLELGLYNPTDELIYLNGYQLSGSSALTIPAGTLIEPGQWHWLSVPIDSNDFEMVLRHPAGFVVDSLRFDPGHWPGGSHFQLKHPQLNNAAAINWRSAERSAPHTWDNWQGKVFLNEVMADNRSGIRDEAGETEDWLEIYNANSHIVDLGGMYLTDDPEQPRRWQIPTNAPFQTTLRPFGHVRFWADGDTLAGPLHLPFRLNKAGESLYLFEKGGALLDSLIFPEMGADTAFGRVSDGAISFDFVPVYSSTPAGPNTMLNEIPRFTSSGLAEALPGEFYRSVIETRDANNDQIWCEAIALPRWAFFTPNNNGGGIVSGNPGALDIGQHLVVLRAWDGYTQSEVFQQFLIEVLDPAEERIASFPIGKGIVYPNPASGPINYLVRHPEERLLRYKIVDVQGRIIWQKEEQTEAGTWETTIPTEAFSAGLYMLQVWEADQLWDLHKLVIQ
ncbi:MAG: CotH kinase family protein, partial [Bacteroidota bacterium]